MSLHEELLSVKLTIETNVILKNGQPMILKLNLPKLNRTPWHIRNLKKTATAICRQEELKTSHCS